MPSPPHSDTRILAFFLALPSSYLLLNVFCCINFVASSLSYLLLNVASVLAPFNPFVFCVCSMLNSSICIALTEALEIHLEFTLPPHG